MTSSYELLFGRRPRTMLPTAATLERRHTTKEMNKTKQSRNNYDWHSSQEKEILDTMELIYAKDTLHSIWIPGTVLNRPKLIKEPRTILINVWGKIYQRTRDHFKARLTTNIANIQRQETPSPAPTQTLHKKGSLLQCQLQSRDQIHKKIQ